MDVLPRRPVSLGISDSHDPDPRLLLQQVTFPLQLLAAKLATALLELVGVPVLLEGNVITIPSGPLNVAEACSGIRSLLTLVTLAIIYGYLMRDGSGCA